MSINFQAPEADLDLKPRIVVVGVGGAGGNAVNNMIQSNLEGVEFVVANTDAQALKHSKADRKIQLGQTVTQGLGAGARPEIGRDAAIESMEDALSHLEGANMVFFTAGMGGGTGTGAAPVLAEACRDKGMLTVGVVTKPFQFEGQHRMRAAEQGIEELQQFVDTLIIIPNQNLFRVANEKTTFAEAFNMADDVLYAGVRGVTDLMVMPGLINLDFADIRTVMSEMGKAMMGTGESDGDNRAILAAESAISNPLLEDVSMKGARGVLINITGGADMTLFEVDEAANRIREEVDADANIIFGSTFDEALDGKMRVSVVATGIDSETAMMPRPARSAVTPLRTASITPQVTPEVTEDAAASASLVAEGFSEETVAHDDVVSEGGDSVEAEGVGEQIDLESMVAETAAEEKPAMADAQSPAPNLFEPLQPSSETSFDEEAPAQPAPEPVRVKDAFIPPRPVRPEELKRGGRASAPEPFNEAALVNAGEPMRPSKPSLLDRITALKLTGSRATSDTAATRQEPTTADAVQAPIATQQAQPLQSPPIQAAPAQQVAQPTPAPQSDLAPTRADEEMLEIPAFLRRQAN